VVPAVKLCTVCGVVTSPLAVAARSTHGSTLTIGTFTFVGEALLMVWLFKLAIKGTRSPASFATVAEPPTVASRVVASCRRPLVVDIGHISSHNAAMRRKPGALLPLEISILDAGLEMQGPELTRFHGFQLAKAMQERAGARRLIAHGTLYKALARLEQWGLLEGEWEDPLLAAEQRRPRRRLYRVTRRGVEALADVRQRPDPVQRFSPETVA
jgi:PadR family transcriptional regulator PadR